MRPILQRLFIYILSSFLSISTFANNKAFVLVIDAGHGGHDAGAIGKISKEKNINLAVALQVGKMIEEKHPDVKVIYTRKTDVFIPLANRAKIANNNKADFFISIHTNAAKSKAAYGTETFVLGLAKTQANLEVAMRENNVITLEDNYKEKYNNFNPNSIDSYIMFELMQDKNQDKSLLLASNIEKQFKKSKRTSRGVRQAGFLVLHQTAAPSVLIELGFISNDTEEKYLNSKAGKEELSNAIYQAFAAYKVEHDKKNNSINIANENIERNDTDSEKTNNKETNSSLTSNQISYKIQLFALNNKINNNDARFKGLKEISYYYESGLYKYTYGNESNFQDIDSLKKSINHLFPDSFIIAFEGDDKISVSEARKKQ